ncbi:tyrosinase-like protein [Lasiosphaeria hispida]|uniref:Tyrosinase-like protein n=1 Tax=Lasiosphaeria hispida TaxID=260671 RepID=A0AAJ0MAQ1_9PEZI|nr:tyrosinase-like protein [Lasiosphaeria hispida]
MLAKTLLCLSAALSTASAFGLPDFGQFAVDSGLALTGLNAIALGNSLGNLKGSCNLGTLKFRQEWRTLSPAQRKNYISAVKCLQAKPSILPPGTSAGSKSLFDDFVYVHLVQTVNIHLTGNFFTWHRYFIHAYEKRLQECGYNGNLPYWEWGYDVNSPRDSPVFDGSDTSLGSDGAAIPHQGLQLTFPGASAPTIFAPGTGGGCVFKGPFKGMTVHLGPVVMPIYGSPNTTSAVDPTADNPRCLKRDLNPSIAKQWTSFRNTTELILYKTNIATFQGELTGDPRTSSNQVGVHGGGHFTIAGDPGADPFISPGDPAFYLHHGQVDRVYWIWQMLDFQNRQNLFGTNTFLDFPPSANTTVDDLINIAPLIGGIPKIKDLMSTVGGTPFCYVYI